MQEQGTGRLILRIAHSQPFSWKAAIVFVITATGLIWYFDYEKERMQKKRVAEANKAIGRPKVGGSFRLVDHNGKPFTEADLKGRYSLVSLLDATNRLAPTYPLQSSAARHLHPRLTLMLCPFSRQVYFGFTHCPDICPEELDKMAVMYDIVDQAVPGGLNGVFVTCDPARDGPEELKAYLAEFHPKFVGLTGTWDEVKAMCKAYRVYFSTPASVPPGKDYLVDHSIYFYLMDPEGDFVEALGRQHSPQQGAQLILGHMKNWKGELKRD